ncbi:MAG: AAA family ATPase [Blastocatellia bacterium]
MSDRETKTDPAWWLWMVEQLRQAPDWPADDLPVEMKQTHISALLLGRRHVAKLKKPVDFGFLDYTTPEKRLRACEDEVRLNRRLCPDTYLGYGGVIELDGKINFSGRHGKIVDHCVWMRRLPDDRMLDRLVAENSVTEAMLDRVTTRLAEFHRTAWRGPEVEKWGSLAEIGHNWRENFAQTESFIGRTINAADYVAVRAWVEQSLAEKAELFTRRVSEHRIVDGHGDVRCESVCVMDDAVRIFDCIEFNERFRCGDPASEMAFLAMDLDARGRPDLGYYVTASYQALRGDPDFFRLLPFYRCYRAYVRGKVLSFELNEPEFSGAEKQAAAARAAAYFALARRYAAPLSKPVIIGVGGLSGTGKTAMARAIAGELGLRVVSADAVRQALFGDAKKPGAWGEGAYTAAANEQTYAQMLERGRALLLDGHSVVLDATFRRPEDRARARVMAETAGANWRLIECQLAPEQARQRLEARAAKQEGLSDATWETYLRQRDESQPYCDAHDMDCLTLDTAGAIAETARRATDWLRGRDSET